MKLINKVINMSKDSDEMKNYIAISRLARVIIKKNESFQITLLRPVTSHPVEAQKLTPPWTRHRRQFPRNLAKFECKIDISGV